MNAKRKIIAALAGGDEEDLAGKRGAACDVKIIVNGEEPYSLMPGS